VGQDGGGIAQDAVGAQALFTFAAYNLTRMAELFGWRLPGTWGLGCPEATGRPPTPGSGAKTGNPAPCPLKKPNSMITGPGSQ